MKQLCTLILFFCATQIFAQQYNNEWIDFSKTYYKFKVGKTGLYRLPVSTLTNAGLGATPAEQFKLIKNGNEVPVYTSVASGVLPANGYIEFWGEINDGTADNQLYLKSSYQHTDKFSLETDTAVYFLTVSSTGINQRFQQKINNVAGNVLPVEQYFMYKYGNYYRDAINPGYAGVIGEYVYSSSYDKGEFWSSNEIGKLGTVQTIIKDLKLFATGPSASLKFGAVGNALYTRNVAANVNSTIVKDTVLNYFNDIVSTAPVPLTSFNSQDDVTIKFTNKADSVQDRMVVSFFELTYPRKFDFGDTSNFEFELPANSNGYYFEITNFRNGTLAPVLYDIANGERYVGDISTAGKVKFALPANNITRRLVLVSQEVTNLTSISTITSKNFTNFNTATNQGDYIIISNPILYKGSGTNNPVNDYSAYRSSTNGGSYKSMVVDVQELIDQFAYGIKIHPSSIKNFLNFARAKFAIKPKYVLLIGKGVTYSEYRGNMYDATHYNESSPYAAGLNLVPTFGWPGSDNLLSSPGVTSPIAATPIGRLSVVSGAEIEAYLEKVKEYESVQRTTPNTIAGKLWMKNSMLITGASDIYLGTLLCNYMQGYKTLLEDTLIGSSVSVFCKSTVNISGDDLSSEKIKQLFETGLSTVTYFGHSSSTNLEFNIESPESYNNAGKYPIFSVNGCNAGNFFTFDPQRLSLNETLSEKFTLAKQKGSIAFIASTHFGVVNYLNIYLNALFINVGKKMYGQQLGNILDNSLNDMLTSVGINDYFGRIHAEEITLHGDPALRYNFQAKPDYVIEEPQVKLDPAFISIAEEKVKAYITMYNIGKAVNDSITVLVKRQYPDGSIVNLLRKKIKGIHYSDTLLLTIPIVATRDKGLNKLIITLDADNVIDEVDESNNTISKDFYVYEDEAKITYPYNFAIVSKQGQKLYGSTANPFSTLKQYTIEIDTTELFNSPSKKSQTISQTGGIIEYDPQIVYSDSTVYYWRLALVPPANEAYHWNNASFIYLAGNREGYNQSHYFQHLKSTTNRVTLNASLKWEFGKVNNNLFVKHGMWVTATSEEYGVSVLLNDNLIGNNACAFGSLVFFVFDPVTFKPWANTTNPNTGNGLYGSWANNCFPGREYNFEYRYTDTASRKKIINFMDNVIPNGAYVLVRAFPLDSLTFPGFPQAYVQDWKKDTAFLGSGNSLYHRFINQGFLQVDSFYKPRTFAMMYKKNSQNEFATTSVFTKGIYDNISLAIDCPTPDTTGTITSPVFGPAKAWKKLQWRGSSTETISTDNVKINIIGVDAGGNETVLQTIDKTQQDVDISAINAKTYPSLKLGMTMVDSINLTPYQLRYWRLDYTPVPEGAVAPNIYLSFKDTVEVGEKIDFGVVFKNVSQAAFDSMRINFVITDKDNVPHTFPVSKLKPLISGDTIRFRLPIDSKDFAGMNTLFVDFNPSNDQPEQFHYNNFLYKNFYVKSDNINPLLDVTFDGIHILNRDIISSKPHIQIKLKDESKYLLLNDTSLITTLTVKYQDANNTVKTYKFDNDTLRFTPPQSGTDNTAVIDFKPYFPTIKDGSGQPLNPEGDEYELTVSAKDRSGNRAGQLQYKISYVVIDKPMISNLLNYPNPFTTSTAFVFTITGSEIPTNFKIQILTITGKVVREITGNEIGPLHIGRNITEFKWDGTDQYGQRLGNGVYLYRVVSDLHGNKMEKYKAGGDETDKFFNKGYGKMYLMK